MAKPLLLIVDGESLKTPGLVSSMEQDGWELRWARVAETGVLAAAGIQPDLVLVDPAAKGQGCLEAVRILRARNPAVPVLLIQGADEPQVVDAHISGYLQRSLPPDLMASALAAYRPVGVKGGQLSSEDIFGDLLEDLAKDGPAEFVAPPPPPPVPPPPPPPPMRAVEAVPPPPPPPPPVPPPPVAKATEAPKPVPAAAPPPPAPKPEAPPPPAPKVAAPPPTAPKAAVPKASPKSTADLGAIMDSLKSAAKSPQRPAAPPPAARPVTSIGPPKPAAPAKPAVPPPAQTAPPPPVPAPPAPPPAPPPVPPEPPLPAAPTAPSAPAAADRTPPPRPLAADEIFGDLDDAFGSDTFDKLVPPPAGREMPPTPPTPLPVLPGEPKEFTLSGISGIHDPFDIVAGSLAPVNAPPAAPPPPPAPPPAVAVGSRAFPDHQESLHGVLEEYGNYYLLEKVAVGGMAELFKAKQRGVHNFQKIVAIKRILPHLSDNDEFVTMFIDEAKLAAQLTHPNIVQIFDLGKASGSYYIAMEFVDGRDLRSLLRKVREYGLPFPESVAAFVAARVAGALDYAHRKRGMNDKELKLVHRDVSPQNILISYDGAVKLVDFGIAKAATKNSQTMAGALKGKLLYMSPEQAMGNPLDSRSDLYSLGLVLFELLTGERCFQADSELGVLEKVRMGRVADVKTLNPQISREMTDIVNKTLAKSVESRYSSARLVERDLKDWMKKHGGEPTEHEVAEYVHALLRGTKEDVEEVLAAKFHTIARPLPVPAAPPAPAEDMPTTAQATPLPLPAAAPAPRPVHVPLPEITLSGVTRRPKWIVPVILLLLAVVAGLLYFALTSAPKP